MPQFARWLHLLSGVVSIGLLALALGRMSPRRSELALKLQLPLAVLLLASGAVVVTFQNALARGIGVSQLSTSAIGEFAVGTHFGRVWLARGVLILALVVVVLLWRQLATRFGMRAVIVLALALAALAQGALALAGHGIALEEFRWLAVGAHAVHILGASVWLGGLFALTLWLPATSAGDKTPAAALRGFSELALATMLAIVISGGVIAVLQIGRWPPLFGTSYGVALLYKLALLSGVLLCAAHLRWRALPTIERRLAQPQSRFWVAGWLIAELALALGVLWLASRLAATSPAQHEQIVWPFAFRLAEQVTWPLPEVQRQVCWGAAIVLAGVFWLGFARRRLRSRLPALLPAVAALAAGLWIALPPLTVAAFPDTYRKASVPYQAISVRNGRELYFEYCAECHGLDATGSARGGKILPKRAADLTAPHAADHTPGDMYWWINHGIPTSGMPGFKGELPEDESWDLVNFVHTLAIGYKARVLRERVAANRPWLGAPDFNYVATNAVSSSLKDFREDAAVLLVLFSLPFSQARLEQLGALRPKLDAVRTKILAVPLSALAEETPPALPYPFVREGAQEIAVTYLLFRRTIENARIGESGPLPAHLEFLIDRYGYVRARWLPEDVSPGWRDERLLLAQLEQLLREPRIKPPPDEHLH
jgi:putative copper export protein/mono/diheme cytochrome c family protein